MKQVPLMPVAVCLIVKNEAARLRRSLPPFAGRVAEIVAYDSGSTDGTIGVLEEFGARVIQGPWLGYVATRRAVWGQARADWLLWLDADEVFSEDTVAALAEALRDYRPDDASFPAGFRVRRQVVFGGQKVRHGDWDRDWVLRVFRRDNYCMTDRRVHESVSVSGRVVRLPGLVAHDSIRSWPDWEARSQQYSELWAQQALEEKRAVGSPFLRALWCFCRGYLIRSGWLDGGLGWQIAMHNAREVHRKYRRLGELSAAAARGSRAVRRP